MAIPTYVINLDRHRDRLAHMRGELAGVAFERVAAVDGTAMPEQTGPLTRFERACLASHQQLWRRLLESGEPHACVLEDDLHLSAGFGALLADARWIPADAHSVKLDTYFQKVMLGEPRPALGRLQIARLYSRHQSSAAYILTSDGAKRYLELTAEPRLPADYALFPKNPRTLGIVIYQMVPAVALQDHLRPAGIGGQSFATGMGAVQKPRRRVAARLAREARRFAGQVADLREAAYLRQVLGAKSTIVGFDQS